MHYVIANYSRLAKIRKVLRMMSRIVFRVFLIKILNKYKITYIKELLNNTFLLSKCSYNERFSLMPICIYDYISLQFINVFKAMTLTLLHIMHVIVYAIVS